MAENTVQQQTSAAQQPRRLSFTQRLLGNSKELFSGYYNSHENDDQAFGHGFNDQADDLLPAFISNNATRRRNSSMSSDSGVEGAEGTQRRSSLSDRIVGMQLMKKTPEQLEQKKSMDDHVNLFT